MSLGFAAVMENNQEDSVAHALLDDPSAARAKVHQQLRGVIRVHVVFEGIDDEHISLQLLAGHYQLVRVTVLVDLEELPRRRRDIHWIDTLGPTDHFLIVPENRPVGLLKAMGLSFDRVSTEEGTSRR
jgi:hypothetical protein